MVTLTESYAIEQARKLDAELAQGKDRGILHGIPYGAKDLFSFPDIPPHGEPGLIRSRCLKKLQGLFKNWRMQAPSWWQRPPSGHWPWEMCGLPTPPQSLNLEEGSSGSSAGSASATAAGLLPFAIGTETWGSIVSPATRCGTTGLRPTYGRVTRSGAMALSWSMDKVGAICRSAVDCAIVFDAIRGSDPKDKTVLDAGFTYPGEVDLSKLKIGYFKSRDRYRLRGI